MCGAPDCENSLEDRTPGTRYCKREHNPSFGMKPVRRNPRGYVPPPGRKCAYEPCGKSLDGERSNRIFCRGGACKTAHHLAVKKAEREERQAARTCALEGCEKSLAGMSSKADYCERPHWYEANREDLLERARLRYLEKGAQIREYMRNYYLVNREARLAYQERWRAANPEKIREQGLKRYWADPEKAKAENRAWCLANPELAAEVHRRKRLANPELYRALGRSWRLRADFDLGLEEYLEMLEAREARCDMCGEEEKVILPNGKRRSLAVDHDHSKEKGEAGFVRGLLCSRDNLNLGKYENMEWRLLAEAYLATCGPEIPDLSCEEKTGSNLRAFGLNAAQYQWLVERCGNRCEMCGEEETAERRLAVDHDHAKEKGEAGYVRGLLCMLCNTDLGLLEDPAFVERAETYLAVAAAVAAEGAAAVEGGDSAQR